MSGEMLNNLYEVLDERFRTGGCANGDARLEQLHSDCRWAEGPLYLPAWRQLIWSDIPNDRLLRWDEVTGVTGVFRSPAGYVNGNTLDREGRLVSCEQGNRRVTRTEHDGRVTVLADRFEGKRLNSPNDLVIKSNGDVYFTDPPYGLPKGAEDPAKELDFQGVYRLNSRGQLTLLTRELSRPNGLAFSPDEQTLYVANSDPNKAIVMAYPVKADGTLGAGKIFFDATKAAQEKKPGLPDGMKVSRDGTVWATAPGGVLVYSPAGKHLGTLATGVPTANLTFGDDGSTLYITADKNLVRVRTKVKG